MSHDVASARGVVPGAARPPPSLNPLRRWTGAATSSVWLTRRSVPCPSSRGWTRSDFPPVKKDHPMSDRTCVEVMICLIAIMLVSGGALAVILNKAAHSYTQQHKH